MEQEKLIELIDSYHQLRSYFHVCQPEEKRLVYESIIKLEEILIKNSDQIYRHSII